MVTVARMLRLVTLVAALVAIADATDPQVFRANDTLLGTPVPCTDEEKDCFRYNRLLDPASGKCYRVGSPGPCLHSAFLLDRQEFESGSGRLVGVCSDPGKCLDHRFRMAYDRKCYTSKEVFGTFCDVRTGSFGWPHFFGGYECVCEGSNCPEPRYVEQPAESGKCLFPNFRRDLTSRFLPRLPAVDLQCSSVQNMCFRQGEVTFGAEGRCYTLLEQGPCPEGQHLVLDKQQAQHQQTVATLCLPVQRCPIGFKFITHLQMCVTKEHIQNILCPGLNTFSDVFGETVCRFKEEFYDVALKSLENGYCKLRYNVRLTGLQELPKSPCTSLDPLDCLSLEQFDLDNLMSSFGNM